MRCAERVDRVWPDYLNTSIGAKGTHVLRTDLNMPFINEPNRPVGESSVSRHNCSAADYMDDSPITVLGELIARSIGRALRERHLVPTRVFASPALRCVQTAVAVARGAATDAAVNVEPALFEPTTPWYAHGLPLFIVPTQLRERYANVADAYTPQISVGELSAVSGQSPVLNQPAGVRQRRHGAEGLRAHHGGAGGDQRREVDRAGRGARRRPRRHRRRRRALDAGEEAVDRRRDTPEQDRRVLPVRQHRHRRRAADEAKRHALVHRRRPAALPR